MELNKTTSNFVINFDFFYLEDGGSAKIFFPLAFHSPSTLLGSLQARVALFALQAMLKTA